MLEMCEVCYFLDGNADVALVCSLPVKAGATSLSMGQGPPPASTLAVSPHPLWDSCPESVCEQDLASLDGDRQ